MELEVVLNKAMAKDRELRYATAPDLALELRAISASLQEPERPVLNPVGIASSKDAATEVEVDEHSQPIAEVDRRSSSEGLEQIHASQSSPGDSVSGPSRPVKRLALRPLQLAAIAGVALVLFFLCGSLGVFGTWAGFRSLFSKETPTAPPTVFPTVAPTKTGNVQDLVLFDDDFSDPNSGWPAGQNASGSYAYQPDGYHIRVSGRDQVQWVSTDRVYDSVSLYVDVTPVTEGTNGYYGLLCRFLDNQNFYYFVIQSNGSYTIGKYKQGQFQAFFPEGWRQSDAIAPSNRLRADCTSNVLRFFVNNVMIAEATDMDFPSGSSGLLAASLDDQDFEVRFNNFLITKAE
jgi:hypothetical protein